MNRQTKSDYVYSTLKKKLINGGYRDRDRLVVADIAQELGVSPMPVREALIKLAQESFVEIIPHVGAKIIQYNTDQLFQIHQARCEFEAVATRLLAPIIKDEQIAILEEILQEGEETVKTSDVKVYFKWNKKFHLTIAKMCPNIFIAESIMNLWQNLELISSRYGTVSWRVNESINEHRMWVESLKTHDAALAEAACRYHDYAVKEENLAKYTF